MKAETLVYKTLLIEQELLSSYINNSNEYDKDVLDSYLWYVERLQFADITHLRDTFKCFCKAVDMNSNAGMIPSNIDNDQSFIVESDHSNSDNNTNRDDTRNHNAEVDFNSFNENNDDNNLSNKSDDHDISSNIISNIVDVYVGTISNYSRDNNNNNNNNNNNHNNNNHIGIKDKYNEMLMNELHSALQLISYTERMNINANKNDDYNNSSNYYGSDNEDINNNDHAALPLQLRFDVNLDLKQSLSKQLAANTNTYLCDESNSDDFE